MKRPGSLIASNTSRVMLFAGVTVCMCVCVCVRTFLHWSYRRVSTFGLLFFPKIEPMQDTEDSDEVKVRWHLLFGSSNYTERITGAS